MPRKSQRTIDLEWSYTIAATEVPPEGRSYTLSPDESQRKAIAKRAGIVRVNTLESTLRVEREKDSNVFIVRGSLKADITQNSAISMEPMNVTVQDDFESFFSDHEAAVPFSRAKNEAFAKSGVTEFPMLEEHEDPEPMENGKIDLGELVTQYFCLTIDPYLRKEGEDYENSLDATKITQHAEKLRPNPFEALKKWRPND